MSDLRDQSCYFFLFEDDFLLSVEIIITICVSEGPVTPQGTGFLALQSVTGTNVSEQFSTVTRSEQLTDFSVTKKQYYFWVQ